MRAGTIVKLPDGRLGTVVYNGLDGVGIKWGSHVVHQEDIVGSGCALIGVRDQEPPEDYRWWPEAMLRNPYPSADLPCVGEEYEVVE